MAMSNPGRPKPGAAPGMPGDAPPPQVGPRNDDATRMQIADSQTSPEGGVEGAGLVAEAWQPGMVSVQRNAHGHLEMTDYFGRSRYFQVDTDIGLCVLPDENDEHGGLWDGVLGSLTRDQREDLDQGGSATFVDPGYFDEIAVDGAFVSNADGTEARMGQLCIRVDDYGRMPLEVLRAGRILDQSLVLDSKRPDEMALEWLAACPDSLDLRAVRDCFGGLGVKHGFGELEPAVKFLSTPGWCATSPDDRWNLSKLEERGRIWFHDDREVPGHEVLPRWKGERVEVLQGRWGMLVSDIPAFPSLNLATALSMADALAERGLAKPMKPFFAFSGRDHSVAAYPTWNQEVWLAVVRTEVPSGPGILMFRHTMKEDRWDSSAFVATLVGDALRRISIRDVIAEDLRISRWTGQGCLNHRMSEDLTRWDAGFGLDNGLPVAASSRQRWETRLQELHSLGDALKGLSGGM